jgi:hypothetical protein
MDIATLDHVITNLSHAAGLAPLEKKAGLHQAISQVNRIKDLIAAGSTIDAIAHRDQLPMDAALTLLKASLRVVAQEDGTVVAVTVVDDEDRVQDVLWEAPTIRDLPEPPGRYHIFPAADGWFEICDTSSKNRETSLGEVVARFRQRSLAWAALLGMNLDSVTSRKIEYLMATPKAKPVGMILILPNLSRAYVDMGRIEWNAVPAHNPLSIKKRT